MSKNRKAEEARKTDDPRYCLYHQKIEQATKNCYILKDKVQAFINTKVNQWKPKQRKVYANMAIFTMGSVEIFASVVSIPAGKVVLVNYDTHN